MQSASSAGIQRVLEQDSTVLLEVGPGRVLVTLAKQNLARGASKIIASSLTDQMNGHGDLDAVMQGLASLWIAGSEAGLAKAARIIPAPARLVTHLPLLSASASGLPTPPLTGTRAFDNRRIHRIGDHFKGLFLARLSRRLSGLRHQGRPYS